MVERFLCGGGEVVLVSAVQGLVSEAERVLGALNAEKPGVVALGLGAEAVAGLLQYEAAEDYDPFEDLPEHDRTYSEKLAQWGDVSLPPPDMLAAAWWARDAGVASFGVDFSEEAYEALFIKEVSTWNFLRYGRVQRRLVKRPPKADDPRAFALAWDARIRKIGALARIEAAREELIASQAARLARERKEKVFLLVDVAREAGVAGHLRVLAERSVE